MDSMDTTILIPRLRVGDVVIQTKAGVSLHPWGIVDADGKLPQLVNFASSLDEAKAAAEEAVSKTGRAVYFMKAP